MNLLDVYPRYDVEPVKGEGCYVWDKTGEKYLDLYCGHAVISIGHSHPHYMGRIKEQLSQLGFYSNSVKISIQDQLAEKLGEYSGYPDYSLFLCNSGAEAAENAMKVASFHTGRKKIIAFEKGFHGRTSLALEATDDSKNLAPVNVSGNVIRVPFNDIEAVKEHLDGQVAGVIIEGIQGIAGIYEASIDFLQQLKMLCKKNGTMLILDEIQAGYGRTGKFFAHQYAGATPDIITTAKGMGNGFPIGGVLFSPEINSWPGMLGTTFGGNHLASAAGLAVLEVLESENLIENAFEMGEYLKEELLRIESVKEVRVKGLMIGIELEFEINDIRKQLVFDHKIFTGSSNNPKTLRLLPPLCIDKSDIDYFTSSLKKVLHEKFQFSS
jgi:acetylornithine aminotransferase